MPSGHHQVADTIASYFKNRHSEIICKKIDLLSAWNPIVESMVTKTYLEWIIHFPKSYAWTYKKMAHTSKSKRSYKYYEILFEKKMKQIIAEENPDLIICTHAFPSYILSKLKMKQQCFVPIINVYTDFFINDVWGKEGIDYHFVPNQTVKNELLNYHYISEENIFITGIPIDEHFIQQRNRKQKKSMYRILISGGSVGLGNIISLIQNQESNPEIEFFVLCGQNKKLFKDIEKLNCSNILPLPYISSRKEMDELYSKVDAIVTKPGGVTISEALKKGLPIFIHSALPGQEEINLKYLKELELVYELHEHQPLNEQMIQYLKDRSFMEQFQDTLKSYSQELTTGRPDEIYHVIHHLVEAGIESRVQIQ